ncbi:hypothetical protein [Chloroherpeton thalassium]|nr:hypothetical protein [Chloroherpeton thalassium]
MQQSLNSFLCRFSAFFLVLFLHSFLPAHAQWQPQPNLFTETYLAEQALAVPIDSAEFPEFELVPDVEGSKSPFIAGLLSFVLPGLGEAYAGNFSTGKYSLGIEIGLIAGFVGTTVYANSLETDFQTLARSNAGVSSSQKSDQFWKDISNYESMAAYNEERMQLRDYNGRYSQEDFWDWDTEANRKKYRDLRISSDEAFQATYFILGAMAVNRLFSAINAVRSVRAYNESLSSSASLRITPKVYRSRPFLVDGVGLNLEKSF